MGIYPQWIMRFLRNTFCLFIVVMLGLLPSTPLLGQTSYQVLRGTVTDKISEKPLPGVSVKIWLNSQHFLGGTTDEAGRYEIKNVPLGRFQIAFTHLGYTSVQIPEILVTGGKEVVLDISLEQVFLDVKEVTVKTPLKRKGAVVNDFTAGSGKSFSLDEVTRFAGGRNDPSKLVSNFAGVAANSDSRNDIVVRGNSPIGVLWRIQGLPSPNPNHFAVLGTTGGPVSALNTNALKTSDFLTGAFSAEYGNATSAVFDINFRNGNTSKFEGNFQINAFSGLEINLEGPLNKKNNGAAYLIGYRYSFAEIANKVGLNIGTKAVPKYQDWFFNITTGSGKLGKFSFYGYGGLSNIAFIGSQLDSTDFYAQSNQDAYDKSNFYALGILHKIDLGKSSYLKSAISFANTLSNYDQYQYPQLAPPYQNRWLQLSNHEQTNTLRFSSFLNQKVNNQFSFRLGLTGEILGITSLYLDKTGRPSYFPFDTISNLSKSPSLIQAFGQFRYRITKNLNLTAGLHGMYYTLNQSKALEPRASIAYTVLPEQTLSFSYGLHNELQPAQVYFQTFDELTRQRDSTNRNLGFTRANHFILGYEIHSIPDWSFKLEAYYQILSNIPVEKYSSGFSLVNAGADFSFPQQVGLVNKGTGFNRGIELSIEKFFSRGYYLLATTSLFDSKYKGSDGILRNSSFNYKYVFNTLFGKEWKIGQNGNAFTLDGRLSTIGGRYVTPVNVQASKLAGYEILDTLNYNSQRLSDYFRMDLKFGYRINSKKHKISQTFFLDLQNITNRKNIFIEQYNNVKQNAYPVYQIQFFPDILYRIQF